MILLIDGNNQIHRAYHGSHGRVNTGVEYFLNMLKSAADKYETDYMLVAFDSPRESLWRTKLYQEYKAHRGERDSDSTIGAQFQLTKRALDELGVAHMTVEGEEADDLIATLADVGREAGEPVRIVTSDKDLQQLVTESIVIYDPMKNEEVGEREVKARWGVAPCRVADMLAIIGDTSDNLPGVPGVGAKTADKLMAEFGSLAGIVKAVDEDHPKITKNQKRKISESDHVRMLKLTTLNRHVELEGMPDSFEWAGFDTASGRKFFSRCGINF